jgi:hypothetical protein
LQLGDQIGNDIAECLVGDCIGEIEAVDVRLFHPLLEQIGDGLRAADEQWAQAADADPFRERADGPDFARVGIRKGFD